MILLKLEEQLIKSLIDYAKSREPKIYDTNDVYNAIRGYFIMMFDHDSSEPDCFFDATEEIIDQLDINSIALNMTQIARNEEIDSDFLEPQITTKERNGF